MAMALPMASTSATKKMDIGEFTRKGVAKPPSRANELATEWPEALMLVGNSSGVMTMVTEVAAMEAMRAKIAVIRLTPLPRGRPVRSTPTAASP